MSNQDIKIYKSGVHNELNDEIIPSDAASDSQNWYTQNGRIKLIPGRLLIGAEGIVGNITGEIFGYKIDGSKVHWRKAGTKIQYLNGATWTDVVTGLTLAADYSFTNYSSLAGSFTFAIGIDGIYKMHNANPGSYVSLYNAAKNFKGKAFIDKGRMILWDRPEDKTGLYGSYIDVQSSVGYTPVTGEATTSLTGTLAFKAGGATRNAFAVTITLTGSGEVYTDKFLGVLTGSLGGTGTINYVTGAYTLSNAGVGTAAYQWEDSNNKGVTDFTFSATRIAGQGFNFRQDEGGDAILNVVIGTDGYYSMKSQSAYRLNIHSDDITADNNVYRKQLGLPSYRAVISTSQGIVFINTAIQGKPEMTILVQNPVGGDLQPQVLFPQFSFNNYIYDDCTIDTYERYVLVACKSAYAAVNDTILLCDLVNKTVDITNYNARTFASNAGYLYIGSSITQSVYQLYSGFDDDGAAIINYWISKNETYNNQGLKKFRKIRIKGLISASQSFQIYISYDSQGFQLVGTVLGSGGYVDYSNSQAVGSNIVGTAQVGGDNFIDAYGFFTEIRLKKAPKFRKRQLKFVALGIGYVEINYQMDWDISVLTDKLPSNYRIKNNVSIDGKTINLPNPQF